MVMRQSAPWLEQVLSVAAASAGPPIAVFDADGTLWDTDASEELLEWIDARGLIPPPPGSAGLKAHSDMLCAQDRATGYAWAAMAYAGCAEAEVAEWAEASFVERVEPVVHQDLAGTIGRLHDEGWDVYIVSASPRWAILPGARRLGLSPDRVLALDVERQDGRLTGTLRGNVTSGAGKAERIRTVIGHDPVLAVGNTLDDVPMIELAEVGVVVNPQTLPDDKSDLAALATSRGWHLHRTR